MSTNAEETALPTELTLNAVIPSEHVTRSLSCAAILLIWFLVWTIAWPFVPAQWQLPGKYNVLVFGLTCSAFVMWSGFPLWTLRIDHRSITLAYMSLFGGMSFPMDVAGAKCRPVFVGFFKRWSTFDLCRSNSSYQIEISRDGEKILFPCINEEQQRENLAKIEQILNSNNSRKGAAASHFAAGD